MLHDSHQIHIPITVLLRSLMFWRSKTSFRYEYPKSLKSLNPYKDLFTEAFFNIGCGQNITHACKKYVYILIVVPNGGTKL